VQRPARGSGCFGTASYSVMSHARTRPRMHARQRGVSVTVSLLYQGPRRRAGGGTANRPGPRGARFGPAARRPSLRRPGPHAGPGLCPVSAARVRDDVSGRQPSAAVRLAPSVAARLSAEGAHMQRGGSRRGPWQARARGRRRRSSIAAGLSSWCHITTVLVVSCLSS
jgi:hypothetical protein